MIDFSKDSMLFLIDLSLTDYGLSQIDTAITRGFSKRSPV